MGSVQNLITDTGWKEGGREGGDEIDLLSNIKDLFGSGSLEKKKTIGQFRILMDLGKKNNCIDLQLKILYNFGSGSQGKKMRVMIEISFYRYRFRIPALPALPSCLIMLASRAHPV